MVVALPWEEDVEEAKGKRPLVPWRHRKAFWAWSRIFGGFIFGGVVLLPFGAIINSLGMVAFGVGFIGAGLAFAYLVNIMTKHDP